jgi:DNA-binding MarR family transcriptional regulator
LAKAQSIGTEVEERPVEASAFMLARLGRVAARQLSDRLAGTGLKPPEAVILITLRDLGPMSQQALGDRLHVDPSNLVAFLNSLENDGLVVRRRDPEDRRRHIVEITERGIERSPTCFGPVATLDDELLIGLSDDEKEELRDMLARVLATMEVDEPPPDAGNGAD